MSISRAGVPPGLRSLLYRWSEGEPGPKQALSLSKPALAPHTQVEIPSPWLDLSLGRRVSLEPQHTGNVILDSMTDPHNLQIVWYAPDTRDLDIIKMTKLISGVPPLGKPILYIIGLCFVSLLLIYSMDVSTMTWLGRDIIDKVKYEEVKLTSR